MTKYLLKEFLIKRSVLKSSISKRDNISKQLKGLVCKNDKTLQNPETGGEKEMFRASSTHVFR